MADTSTETLPWRMTSLFLPRKSIVTGRLIVGPVMMRVVSGRKLYREMTTEESFDVFHPHATAG